MKEEVERWKMRTWPPTTATEGRASQSDNPSPPWSPRTVQARWIRFTSPIKLSIVAIFFEGWIQSNRRSNKCTIVSMMRFVWLRGERKKDMDPRTECGINQQWGFQSLNNKKNGLDAERGSRERERVHGKNGWGMKPNSCFYFFSCFLRNLALLESYYVCLCIMSHISKKKYFRNNLFLFFFPSFAFPYELQKW